MIPIFPCDRRRYCSSAYGALQICFMIMIMIRSKGFPATSGRGAEDLQTCPNFAYGNGYIHTECNCTGRQIWINDAWKRVDRRPLHSYGVSTKYLCPYPKIPPKPNFGGPFNTKPIIERVIRKSNVNTYIHIYITICIARCVDSTE